MKKIGLIGPFPPPLGGVAIHLSRLYNILCKEHIAVQAFSTARTNILTPSISIIPIRKNIIRFIFALIKGFSIIHYHTDERDWKATILLALWCSLRRQPYILTLHSFRQEAYMSHKFFRWLLSMAYNYSSHIICISSQLKSSLLNTLPIDQQKISIIGSFLPIMDKERQEHIQKDIGEFIEKHSIIVCSYAYSIINYHNVDLYGSDLFLQAAEILSQEFPSVGFLLIIVNRSQEMEHFLSNNPISYRDKVYIVNGHSNSFIPILLKSHIFVRPTYNDGGVSLSVLEALSLGKWCIASDTITRHPNCILFKNRDVNDLVEVLRQTISHSFQSPAPIIKISSETISLLNLYNQFSH